jgi:hypothetical protein
MIILRGLIWFFIFKSVSFSAVILKLFYTQLRLCANLRVLCASSYCGSDPSLKIPVNVLYSKNVVKSCLPRARYEFLRDFLIAISFKLFHMSLFISLYIEMMKVRPS